MPSIRTFAIIGVSETKSLFLAKQIAKTNQVLLFDLNAATLLEVQTQILLENPEANVEMMICPTNASWEADVIILSNYAATDTNLAEKVRKVATGKVVLVLVNEMNPVIFENPADKFQLLFPFSKVIQSIESTDDLKESLFLKGNDADALKTILTLFAGIGFKTNILI
ncbi:hypothetical protein ACFX5F_11560 [Flavobacterium sp. ZS1P70]|uniref:Pyrroline-5-carboxylate reductase catalytic N-terminal domain-containing protein n=1 Tax=Flavobacterium zhoui TaxID=3230414 RepID=A0ABW6I6D9_9FLAO